jgi:uncharacterized delta-60 repeat protein
VDTSFGSGGYTATDFYRRLDIARAVALQPQTSGPSKILAAGEAVGPKNTEFAVARYNANGTLDTTFGSKGKVTTDFGVDGWVQAIVVDAAGRIVVVGGAPGGLALVRYTANGALDSTFGSGGKFLTGLTGSASVSLALQGDGKIVLSTDTPVPAIQTRVFLTARFNTNGTFDSSFGNGGQVTTHVGNQDGAGGVAIDGSGHIVVAGAEGGNDADGVFRGGIYLLRYTTSGALDPSFGAGGFVYLVGPDGLLGQGSAGVAVQANAQIVAGGQLNNAAGTQSCFGAVRVSTTGTLDPGFGDSGWATVQYTGGAGVRAFALQPDGRVLLAGEGKSTSTGPMDVALARLLTSAPQIGSFTANPNPVTSGSSTTLTVSNITDANPSATVAQVAFYIMVNGNPLLLGYGTHNSDGSWSLAFDTAGYAPGAYTLYAQATDNYGALGNPVDLTLTIQ